MIKFGAEEIFKSRQEDVTEADIDRLLDEGEKISNQLTDEARQQVQMSLASFQLGAEEANIYDFEGMNYKPGVESRMLHVHLKEPVSQLELHQQCSQYGEVIRTVLHPNLKEALVYFRSTSGAIEAKANLPYESAFAARDSQTVVTSEMVAECLGAGEKLGRGHRVREPVQFYSEEDVQKLQTKAVKAPPLKLPKMPRFHPYQLYNAKRLIELHNTEVALMVRNWKRKYDRDEKPESPTSAEGGGGVNEEDLEEETLTAVEQEERERLLNEGFPNWSYQEYRAVVTALTSGDVDTTDYPALTAVLDGSGKTVGEVRDYVSALLERGEQCIKNFTRVEDRIRKAQQKREAKGNYLRAAKWKVESCERPERQLTFRTKGNPALDRRLFLLGYDSGFKLENVGEVVQKLPENRFNVWYQSRPESFFEGRLRALVRSVKREWEKPSDPSGEPESTRYRVEAED